MQNYLNLGIIVGPSPDFKDKLQQTSNSTSDYNPCVQTIVLIFNQMFAHNLTSELRKFTI